MKTEPENARAGDYISQEGRISKPAHWIEPDEYFALALSNRRLLRCDQPGDGVRGLHDPETGERYLIREENVLTLRTTGRAFG